VVGSVSDDKGYFEISVSVSDTLLLSYIGYQSLKIRVTNDWIKNKTTKIQMTEKAIALIVNGYCKEVFNQLPMEFAVEAQKLLAVSLEGSVG
jgi:hypothetical protein